MLVVTSKHVFTGDFLFTGEGGVGRDDLPSGRMHAHWGVFAGHVPTVRGLTCLHRSRGAWSRDGNISMEHAK